MGNSKKLDISFAKLCEIAEAINNNNKLNKLRFKEEKINTDKFIKEKFDINRKDFSFTIKDFGIKYNKKTFLYEIPNYKSNTIVINSPCFEETAATSENLKNDINDYKNNTSVLNDKLEDIMPTLLEIIDWYKQQKKCVNEISNSNSKLEFNLSDSRLNGAIGIHSLKCYENIYEEFIEVCKQYRSCKRQDLLSIALLNFIETYKK